MARPKKTKQVDAVETEKTEPVEVDVDYGLPQKALFRVDEVARYFSITERCVRLWIEHGHLKKEKINGVIRVPRMSILRCRFNKHIDIK
jgi:hypothetical protein